MKIKNNPPVKRLILSLALVFLLFGSRGVDAVFGKYETNSAQKYFKVTKVLDSAVLGTSTKLSKIINDVADGARGVKVVSRFPTYFSDVIESLSNLKWNNTDLLAKHYSDHGGSVGANSAIDYIYRSKQFINRAIEQKLPTKFDVNDVTFRVWDPATGEFASFYRDGGIRTYFNKFTSKDWNDPTKGKGYLIK